MQAVPKMLGVKLEPTSHRIDALTLTVKSIDVDDKPAPGLAATAEIYRVSVSTVKERLAPNLKIYRNFPKFEKVWEKGVTTPAEITVPTDKPGRYVVKVTAPSQPNTPQVSATAMLGGYWDEKPDAEGFVPVESESGLSLKAERARYTSGETAMIALETPFTGTAIVMVATDHILWRDTVAINSNHERIAVPVQPSFAPNAHVCVHLIKAAGADGIPAERYGTCELRVDRADRLLEVKTQLTQETVQPGDEVSGVVRVKLNGKPVAGADLLLFAVDDAILELGQWKLPDLTHEFFGERTLGVTTRTALGQYVAPDEAGPLTRSQKGFILGASGMLKGDRSCLSEIFQGVGFFGSPTGRRTPPGKCRFTFKPRIP